MSHKVFLDFDLRDTPVQIKDLVFKIYRDDEKFGELRISRGAVVWRGRSDQKGRKLTWARFDALMQDAAKLAEKRKPGARLGVPRSKRAKY